MTSARDRVVGRERDHEVITTPETGTVIATSAEYRTLAEEMLESGNCALFVSNRKIPFYLGLYEQFVQIGVEDDA
ncbi:hypothetical protein [Halosolutus gelatinilyticus]|uniref:transcriptional regulator FilR1 domain-containing protein n=1 Tax=Halosolutus gelatinilyticus TaxID=2931975 RepID=UPI001FF4B4A9|nr:hypothetical protein [Halosolutus gelatinilyticus]